MFMISPPITAIANGCCICAPGPKPSANGRRPKLVVRLVIRIGLKRTRPAVTKASCSGIPCSRNWPIYSMRMIPFFTSKPTTMIAPINDDTLSGVPVIQRAA